MSARKGQPSGKCAVCGHADQVRIELLLAGGAGQAAVGRKFNLSKDTIHRHWHNHVTMERRAMLVMGPVPRQALAAQVCEENSSVLDICHCSCGPVEAIRRRLDAAIGHAVHCSPGKLHQFLSITARTTGELAQSPLVSITNNQQNIGLMIETPEFAEFQARLVAVLRDFPEARLAVLREFEHLESSTNPPVESVPQLTQERARGEEVTEVAA